MQQDLLRNLHVKDDSPLSFMKWWIMVFPLDYWWRKKYNVAFGSDVHRNMSIEDIICDYEEAELLKEIEKDLKKEKDRMNRYLETPRELLLLDGVEVEYTDEEFLKIDLDSMNDLILESVLKSESNKQ